MALPKKPIDVEQVLRWCYAWEMLKDPSAPPQMMNASQALASYAELMPQTVHDGRGAGGSWPFLDFKFGGPHPDALVLNEAVQAMAPEGLVWPESREPLLGPIAGLAEGGGFAFLNISFKPAALIVTNAVLGRRPDWCNEQPTPARVVGPNGKAVVVGIDSHGRYSPDAHCPLAWSPDPFEIVRARAEYAVWHGALVRLANQFRESLIDHAPVLPSAPSQPWLDPRERRGGRVLRSIKVSSDFSPELPLAPQAGLAAA